ncbi:BioY family transporter [Stappia taiwanensis]|nr:biotin transporter BioY [Stappia taiwanensis]GGF07793.1 BioY family transporter [Stappia taiwanensis]
MSKTMTADRSLVHIAIYAAMIGALGLLPPFSLPMLGGVPITAQTLGVMLAGTMLGPGRGALAVLLFLFVVALGMPLLAGGRGGLGVFAGPSVGFLVGWPIGAFVCGLMMRAMRAASTFTAALVSAFVGGILVMYAFGIPGLSLMTDLTLGQAAFGVLIYLPGDTLKVFATAVIVRAVERGRPDAVLTRQ